MTGPLPSPRVAVLGAGPIGLEAAVYAAALGYPVTVYEQGGIADHVRQWGHVRLFTPWSLNTSPLARRRLLESGFSETDIESEARPTGAELIEGYLEPLSRLPELSGRIRLGHRVVRIARDRLLKSEAIGDRSRGELPFTLLIDTPRGEVVEEADLVLDATGVFGQPNPLGRGGMPAPGESRLGKRRVGGVPDIAGSRQAEFAGRRVLIVGGGQSAATSAVAFAETGASEVTWITRSPIPPLTEIDDDPLPGRSELIHRANALVTDPPPRFHHLGETSIRGFEPAPDGVRVSLEQNGESRTLEVDLVLGHTGFRPDNRIYSELQVHECYASQGPMALSAALMGAGAEDCMTQTSHGPETLRNPEPGFFILGNKSYGRNSNFLLRIGRDQVRDVFQLVSEDSSLDLYAKEVDHVG